MQIGHNFGSPVSPNIQLRRIALHLKILKF